MTPTHLAYAVGAVLRDAEEWNADTLQVIADLFVTTNFTCGNCAARVHYPRAYVRETDAVLCGFCSSENGDSR